MTTSTYMHATFDNGETALFRPTDRVWVCGWLSDDGEYYAGEDCGIAADVVKPGVYVLDAEPVTDEFREWVLRSGVLSKVKIVREIEQWHQNS